MLLSMMLIAVASVLVRRAGEPDGVALVPVVGATTERWTRALFVVTSIAIVTGTVVTGAGPHAGDETAERLDVAIPTAARLHGITVISAIVVALVIAWRLRSRPAERVALTTSLSRWLGVALMQAALGYVQYLNDVPELLVGIHVLGATLVMIATTFLALDTRRPTVDPSTMVRIDDVPARATTV
jgi:cytochrome c oxidase assembly protein subunit 15